MSQKKEINMESRVEIGMRGAGKSRLDLDSIPVVDAHCHPVAPQPAPLSVSTFEQQISMSFMEQTVLSAARRELVRGWPSDSMPRRSMMLNMLYRQMAQFLQVPLDPESIIRTRNERAQEFDAYVRTLLDDAAIEQFVVDSGFPPDLLERFRKTASRPVWEVVRIENVMETAAQAEDSFDRYVDAYCTALEQSLRSDSCKGLKSVIAYLTGLDIGPKNEALAREAFPGFAEKPFELRTRKHLRDYCFHLALELCIEYDKPMQVHCGCGNDEIYLSRSAPNLMYELLVFPPYSDCIVVLVHGGYPWAQEAAIMANILPNLFLDISATCPFISYGVTDFLWDILKITPINKVMYGSDGFHMPELYWFSAKVGRNALGQVLSHLIDLGHVNESESLTIARHILHDNAVEVYGLS